MAAGAGRGGKCKGTGALPGPVREGEAQVEAFLKSQKLGVRPCSDSAFQGFDEAHNWGNCGRTNRGGAWACPAKLGQNWQCNVDSPFNHVQEGGGCEEYCRWPTSPP